MAYTNLSKVSGVVSVYYDGDFVKAYFNAVGKYQKAPNGYNLIINGDPYQIALDDLQVNGVNPPTAAIAEIYLNDLFGS